MHHLSKSLALSKILKSTYIRQFNKIFDELPNYYIHYQYEIDMKTFFNDDEESNNVIPNFISTNLDALVINNAYSEPSISDNVYGFMMFMPNFSSISIADSGKYFLNF